ncbi:hypothetical protein [Hippea alviniae]|uniref:hypothetical protein n=1 Tax=Hippea alviniae TaxID=1279027 RepID=UPI0003B4B4B5|nr:hypothetical protein [Hippea alviniae]
MVNTRAGRVFNILFLITAVIVVGLIAKGIYSRQIQLRELKKESSLLDKRISEVKQQISTIKMHIKMAKSDPYYIKQKATDKYLMINNKDETIMIFPDPQEK